jgi:hypothetical protein
MIKHAGGVRLQIPLANGKQGPAPLTNKKIGVRSNRKKY